MGYILQKSEVASRSRTTGNGKTLGSILVERGALSSEALAGALAEQCDSGRRLGEILIDQGLLGEEAGR
ncbi:MAG TPA: hypothetical protein VK997_11350 [Deferrisomatales bacterium]|nr:hypothetical protein [Deferrisomatales bacterium]